ncbi:hypothetical protein D3C78_1269920 [compost metagenome]
MRLRRCPLRTKRLGVGVEIQAPPYDLATGFRCRLPIKGDVQPKTIQQLRTQLTLLRVHGANQYKARAVTMRNTVALDSVGATGGDIEQQVDQMIGQQVDLIDIQHPPVSLGQHARRKLCLTLAQCGLQIKGTDQPLFARPQRQGYERAFTEQISQTSSQGALGHAAWALDQYATDLRVDGGQAQGQLQCVGTDHSGQGKMCRFSHFRSLLHRPAVALRGLHGTPPVVPTGRAAGLRAGAR